MVVEPRIQSVFVPVRDMQRAIAWYSALLGLPAVTATHEGLIYDLPLPGETGLKLDGHAHTRGEVVDRAVPLLMFGAEAFDNVLDFARAQGTGATQPEDIGSAHVLYLDDPDGNHICIKVDKN
jgi:catechol 2,3-dioxygenase-like lactoylglutathione lyase family enzyme